jgi:hypothetical protein
MSQSNLDERDEESGQDTDADISSGGKSEEEIIELRKSIYSATLEIF